MVSALNYPIVFDFTTKGQEQLGAADKLIRQLEAILKQVSGSFATFGTAAEQSSTKVATSQTKIGDSAARVVTEVGKEGQAFTQLDASQTKVGASSTNLVTNQDKIGASTTKLNTEITKEQQTLTALDQTQVKAGTSMTQMSTAQTAVATSAVKVGTELGKQNVALTTMDESQKKLATDMGAVTTGMEKQTSTVTKGSGEMTKLTKETDSTEKSTKKLQGTVKESVSSFDQEGKAVQEVGTKMKEGSASGDKLAASTKKAEESSKTLKQSLTSLAGGVTTLGTGIVTLWQSYDSLGDAQLAVDKTTRQVSVSQEALNKAQAKLNVLVAEGRTGTAEYSQALLDVEQAHMKLQITLANQVNAQEQLNVTQANFYMNVIPQLMGVLGSLATIYGSASLAVDKFKLKTAEAGVQMSLTSKLMATISVTNPFFLALTIGGSILAAFVTNLGGFRDMLNGVGVAIGNAVGPLKPFLTFIGDLGNGLSKMFGGGVDDAQAFEAGVGDSMGGAEGAFTSFGDVAAGVTAKLKGDLDSSASDVQKYTNELVALDNQIKLLSQASTVGGKAGVGSGSTPPQSQGPKQGPVSPTSRPDTNKNLVPGVKQDTGMSVNTSLLNLGDDYKKVAQGVSVYRDELGKLSIDEVELTNNLQSGTPLFHYRDTTIREINRSLNENHAVQAKLGQSNIQLLDSTKILATATGDKVLAVTKDEKATKLQELATAKAQYQTDLFKNTQNTLKTSIDTTGVSTDLLTKQLSNQTLITMTLQEAEAKQDNLMKQQQVTVMQQVATTLRYNEQLQTQEGIMLANATGRAKQLDAFVKEKAAVQENIGVYQELNRELGTGEGQIARYNKVYSETAIAIKSGALEVSGIRAEIAATADAMKTGEAQNNAWAKGFEGARQQIQQATIAVIEQEGALVAQARALRDGTLAETAHAQATNEFRAGLISQITDIEKLKQTMNDYGESVKEGIPQSLAYAKAFLEQSDSALHLDEELAGLMGTYKALRAEMDNFGVAQTKANIAFMDGQTAALTWKQGLLDSQQASLGMMSGLDTVAKQMGVTIPQAFKYSNDAAKEWIEIQMKLPDAIAKGLKKAVDDGKEALDALTEAWDKGNNLSKKEVEKILGENIPSSYRKKLDYQIEIEVNEAEMTKQLNDKLAVLTKYRPDTREQGQQIVGGLLRDINTAFKDGKVSEEFNNSIVMMMGNMPDPKDVPAWDAWIAEFKALQEAIASGDPEKIRATIKAMTERQEEIKKTADNILAYEQAIKKVADNIDTYMSKIQNKSQLSAQETEEGANLAGDLTSSFADFGNEKAKQVQQQNPDMKKEKAQKVDTTAIDEAMAKLKTFATALSLLGPAATEAVNQVNTAFGTLNPLSEGFQDGVTAIAEAWALMIEAAGFTVEQINAAMNLIGTTFDPNAVSGPVIGAFQAARDGSQPHMRGLGTDFSTLVVGPIQTATRSLGSNIVAEFEKARAGVIEKFNAMGSAAQSTFGQILEYVKAVTTELKSVPSVIPVEYRVSVTGDSIPPSQVASGFSGVVDGAHTITVGEAGREFVSVIPLDKPGARTPLSAGNRSFAAQGFQGVVGTDQTTNTTTSTGIPGTQAGVQDVRVVGIGLQTVTGGVLPVFISGSAIALGSGGGGTGSSGGGVGSGVGSGTGSIGGGGGSGTGTGTGGQTNQQQKFWVTENGTQYYYENIGGVIKTNMPPEMLSRYKLASPSTGGAGSMGPWQGPLPGSDIGTGGGTGGTPTGGGGGFSGPPVPAGVQTTGSGPHWAGQADPDPTQWKTVPMENDPSKFKVIDKNGRNVAAGFTSKQAADDWRMAYKPIPGTGTGGGGGTPTGGGGGGGTPGTPAYTRKPPTGPGGLYPEDEQRIFGGYADVGISSGANLGNFPPPGISMDGRIHFRSGGSYSVSGWNALSDSDREWAVQNAGLLSIPEGSFLNEDYSITEHYFQRPLNARAGPDPYDPNATRATTAGTPATGGSGGTPTGGGGGASTLDNPDDWSVTSGGSGTEVHRIDGSTVAKGFSSHQAGVDYMKAHQDANDAGRYTGPIGPGQTLNGYHAPANITMGTSPSTGTGAGGTPTGYTVPPYVATTGGSKWQNPNMDPTSWKSTAMTGSSYKGLWKVVDDKEVIIAAEFKSKAEADEFISEHVASGRGAGVGPPSGGTGGNITPPVSQNGTGTTTGGTPTGGNAPAASMPENYYNAGDYDSGQIQTSGTGDRWKNVNKDPTTWKVAKMENGSGWKVVDDKGKNIATGFGAEDQAGGYIDDAINKHGYNDTSSPDFINDYGQPTGGSTTPPVSQNGTGTSTGTIPSSGTGTGTSTPAPTYTVPSDVVAHDPNPSGDEEWEGPIDTSDPSTWRVERHVEPNPVTGQYRWKVVNKDGKNIALRFDTKEAAEEYIAKHQQAKQGGTYTTPTEGGGSLTLPGGTGTGGTPTTGGGTPTGGGGSVPQPGQTSGTGEKWQGENQDKATWKVVPMTDADKSGKWKVVDDKGKNIAALFNSKEDAELWLAAQKGQTNPPTVPGGTGAGGTPTGGGTTPPVNQNGTGGGMVTVPSPYDYGMDVVQINDNGKQLFWKKQNGVITTNMNSAQLARYGLQSPSGMGGVGAGGGTGSGGGGGIPTGGGGGVSVGGGSVIAGNASVINGTVTAGDVQILPDGTIKIGGKVVIPGKGGAGGIPTGGGSAGSGTVNLGSGTLMRTSDVFGDNRNYAKDWDTTGVLWAKGGIKTQLYPVSQDGTGTGTSGTSTSTQTRTNTGGNYQFIDANGNTFNSQNDVNTQSNTQSNILTPTGGNTMAPVSQTGTGTGTTTPTTGRTTTGTSFSGGGVTQSQTVTQSGTGGQWYYQNQDGRVNTNMSAEMLARFGLPGGILGGGGGGLPPGGSFGNRAEPGQLDVRTGIDNTVPIYDVGPTQEGRDFATQRIQTGGGAGGGGSGLPNIPGFPFGDIGKWIQELMASIMGRIKDGLSGMSMNIDLDGQPILKSYSTDILRRYNSQF